MIYGQYSIEVCKIQHLFAELGRNLEIQGISGT